MLNKTLLALSVSILASTAFAETAQISGNVESKCTIVTETTGVYGNPTTDKLSTLPASGGVIPIVRYDVVSANHYKAKITTPIEFSSSPTLDDVVAWTGTSAVTEVSVSEMSAYDTNKVIYDNVTEYNLTLAGTTWFKAESTAIYGYDKSFPSGNYNAVVEAECIAL